jgi:aminoglycoside phosphotransferase (APT) family kinase protein
VTFCIEEKLPGTPLDQLIKQGANVDQAISHIGELLSKIHSVKVNGYGYLQPDGSAWQMPFSRIMLDLNDKQDDLKKAAARWDVPLAKVETGLALLNSHIALYEWNEPSLTHGDFCPAHILVKNDSITGIIDMEECSGNHPVADFVWWETTAGKDIPIERLKKSYTNKLLFDENFDALFHLALLRHCFWMLIVRVDQGNEHAIDDFKHCIDKALKFFNHGTA